MIKTLGSQLAALMGEAHMRRNIKALVKYVLYVVAVEHDGEVRPAPGPRRSSGRDAVSS